MTPEEAIARNLSSTAATYQGFVGGHYDMGGALHFNVLTFDLGLLDHHYFLDIGCGSLRSGRFFIPYLLPGHYFGIEPEMWVVDEAIEAELGRDILRVKNPTFSDNEDFELTIFNQTFDYLLAGSIFTHAGPEMIRKCLSEAKQVMSPEAIFLVSYYRGVTEWVGEGWHPGSRFYKEETMRGFVEGAGGLFFTPYDISGYQPPDWPANVTQDWFLITTYPIEEEDDPGEDK